MGTSDLSGVCFLHPQNGDNSGPRGPSVMGDRTEMNTKHPAPGLGYSDCSGHAGALQSAGRSAAHPQHCQAFWWDKIRVDLPKSVRSKEVDPELNFLD